MPRSLKVYIAGVVTLSAVALVVATLLFPADDSRISRSTLSHVPGARCRRDPSQLEILAGVAFWTVLTLVASALPVRLPRGTHQAVAMAPIVAAMSLGGPAVGGWVAAIGTTEMRELRGRIPWYGIARQPRWGRRCPPSLAGVVQVGVLRLVAPPDEWALAANFVATMLGAAVFYRPECRRSLGSACPAHWPVRFDRWSLATLERPLSTTSRWPRWAG